MQEVICEQVKEEKSTRLKDILNRKNIITTMIVVVAILVALGIFKGWQWWSNYSVAPKQNTQSVVAGVRELASLLTAELQVVTTLEGKDNKLFGIEIPMDIPGTKRVYFIVIPAKVMAGINMEGLDYNSVTVDDKNKIIHITLPPAEFIQEAIELDKLKIYTGEGLLRPRTTIQESLEIINGGQVAENIRQEAINSGLLKVAEHNAVKVLENFYKGLGYQVEVSFNN